MESSLLYGTLRMDHAVGKTAVNVPEGSELGEVFRCLSTATFWGDCAPFILNGEYFFFYTFFQ